MELYGYTDKWVGAAGDTIQFFVSCEAESYAAELVQLIHTDPRGPGHRERRIEAVGRTEHPGRRQAIHTGSYVRIPALDAAHDQLTGTLWTWPTLPGATQSLLSSWDPVHERGFSVHINTGGEIALRLGGGRGSVSVITTGIPVQERCWYFIAFSIDFAAGTAALLVRPREFSPAGPAVARIEGQHEAILGNAPLLIGAAALRPDGQRDVPLDCFNGKIANAGLFAAAVPAGELGALYEAVPAALAKAAVGRWDFAVDMAGTSIADTSPRGCHGVAVNRPTRAVTGPNWDGSVESFTAAPHMYNAIHCHEDDLDDAGWEPSFAFEIPESLPSAVYAMKLTAADTVDYVPFFIRRPTGKPAAKVAVQIPTLSYMAYSNDIIPVDIAPHLSPRRQRNWQLAEHDYIARTGMRSTYDAHNDGSGVCHVSLRRPTLTTLRPLGRERVLDCAHQFPADLYMIDWLEEKNIDYDIITDHCLHRDGAEMLKHYNVVVSGTHPEYWTGDMLDALAAYKEQGGRYMYLGGNGLYWVTALDPDDQSVMEIRRCDGIRTWEAQPGETCLSFSGERGGIWAARGRAPEQYVGVGMIAQGFDRGCPYQRLPDSFDARASFIFEGVGDDEIIGDFQALTLGWGAAGYEIDCANTYRGTPRHALILAEASEFTDCYQRVVEQVPMLTGREGGSQDPGIRAHMVFFETPQDGAVFSTSAISWCSALSYNNYDNNVSRITENVLRAFAADGPLPGSNKRS
ncbi:MAG: LamG domain-containing protein [Gammaproteobacteria bacterium]|nr:LamG domain-containing protein [Gammaproteobacteria bacterium]